MSEASAPLRRRTWRKKDTKEEKDMRIAVDIDDTLNVLDRVNYAGEYIRRNALPKAVPFEKVKDAIKNQLAAKFMQSYVESLQKSDIVNNITVPAEEAAPAETAAPAEAK